MKSLKIKLTNVLDKDYKFIGENPKKLEVEIKVQK